MFNDAGGSGPRAVAIARLSNYPLHAWRIRGYQQTPACPARRRQSLLAATAHIRHSHIAYLDLELF